MVRTEGLTEGDPSAPQPIDLTVTYSTRVTSRLVNPDPSVLASEAQLFIDEPAADQRVYCTASAMKAATCPVGANAFQGIQSGPFTLTWTHIPFTPPGPGKHRVLRIQNVRVDASSLPPMVYAPNATVTWLPADALTLDNPNPAVVITAPGLTWSLQSFASPPTPLAGPLTLPQCVARNQRLSANPANSTAPQAPSFIVRVTEGFASAFKKWTWFRLPWMPKHPGEPETTEVRASDWPDQNLLGISYNLENGFFTRALASQPDGLGDAGYASSATRFTVKFSGPPGVQFHAPAWGLGSDATNSLVRLAVDDPAAAPSLITPYVPLGPASSALRTHYHPSHTYVYEITSKGAASNDALDSVDLPFYIAHPGTPAVGLGPASVSVYFSPTANTAFASQYAPIPRFKPSDEWRTVANVTACEPKPKLAASLGVKSGPSNARVWPITLTNNGTGVAANARVTAGKIIQTAGPACSPTILTPFPLVYGDLAAGSAATKNLTLNLAACTAAARFSATFALAPATTASEGFVTLHNLLP
ncbi:MAG: hypothetical protein SFV54_27065 [Bryobacteraceae bacterium]|nr:hypothetical protein [Bryobacteraceae bacterium]